MFKHLRIKNFKSIKDLTFEFDRMNILIGMNGAGKSTILQAIDFISQIFLGDINGWLENRDWAINDLNCKIIKDSNIDIELEIELEGDKISWIAEFNRSTLKCTTEKIILNDKFEIFSVKSRAMFFNSYIDENEISISGLQESILLKKTIKYPIIFNYEGSVLSILNFKNINIEYPYEKKLNDFKKFIGNIKSLELLAPHLMRKRTRITNNQHIGIGGEKLSSFLSTLDTNQKNNLIGFLKKFYPKIIDFKIVNLRSGWKKLIIIEDGIPLNIETEARHINDGLLRILAILAQIETKPSFLMLDEIENGVNQEIVEELVNILLEMKTQLLVTTHSPLVLNYLPDEIAKKSINYVYKAKEGDTKVIKFFDLPKNISKLEIMGVGDVVLDTNLIDLEKELNN